MTLPGLIERGKVLARVDADHLSVEIAASDLRLATSWLEGRRQYRDEPLGYVLADIARFTGRQIDVSPEAGALRFTGTLSLPDSAAWLDGLAVALPVTVQQGADRRVIVQLRPRG